jgi:hypothetical protein
VRVRFRSCLLSSALRCHWDGFPHFLLDLTAEGLRGGSQGITQVLAAPDQPVERAGCTVISILSIASYTCHVSKPAKHCEGRSETCALDLQRLRLTVNEYCGAARNTRRPAVADGRCCFAGT